MVTGRVNGVPGREVAPSYLVEHHNQVLKRFWEEVGPGEIDAQIRSAEPGEDPLIPVAEALLELMHREVWKSWASNPEKLREDMKRYSDVLDEGDGRENR